MIPSMIWAENLLLLHDCVKQSGGVLNVNSSYVDEDGDLLLHVTSNIDLSSRQRERYHGERIRREK